MEYTNEKLSPEMIEFLHEHHEGVISTLSIEGFPQVAAMGYLLENDQIVLLTKKDTNKYQNLSLNPKAGFVVSDHKKLQTIQMECETEDFGGMEGFYETTQEIFEKFKKHHINQWHPSFKVSGIVFSVIRLNILRWKYTEYSV